jgi:glycosyltransferase involved in cell wall biosynthesis
MRVFVVEPDGAGGMTHYAYQLCDAMAAAGADVTLITSHDYELGHLPHRFTVDARMALWANVAPGSERERSAAAHFLIAAGRKLRRIWRAIRYAWAWERLTRHLIRERPDVVQFGIIRFPFVAFYLRRLQNAGLTLTQVCHEWEAREAGAGPLRRVVAVGNRAVYPTFSAIFFHGEANRAEFRRSFDVPIERTHLIRHGDESMFTTLADPGGDARSRYGIPTGRPVAVFFGGLRPSKGLDDLLHAFAAVREQLEATLVVAGAPQGVEPADLRAMAARLGIAPEVVIDGRYLEMDEVGPLMRAADVVVLPYRTATASGALQVAYAFARPVIVTDVGALPEAVDDGRTGVVVPPERPDLLAAALVKVLTDQDEARAMGREGAALARERFSWAPIARKVLAVSANAIEEVAR